MSVRNFDAVLTYHNNMHTCGVARFNHYLAQHLSVPMLQLTNLIESQLEHPIVSIKVSEFSDSDFTKTLERILDLKLFSLILHDFIDTPLLHAVISQADSVMGLNSEIVSNLHSLRQDAALGFTVASYGIQNRAVLPDLKLITFGMAHKIQSSGYQRVAELLKADSRSHILEISSALHEGTKFDDSYFEVGDEISEFFGGKVRFLGFLADPEVSLRVSRSSAMLAFFPCGARENNNSVVSAMHLAVPVITNLDDRSPSWLRHGETVFDVRHLSVFPSDAELRRVGDSGRSAVEELTYENLLKKLIQTSRVIRS